MVVVSSREFRANQRKYFELALSDDVVIMSRSYGSYRLVPLSEDDSLVDAAELDARIRRGIAEYEACRSHPMHDEENTEEYLDRMIKEP